jgi:biotin operon repressor
MERQEGKLISIRDVIERNIELSTPDPVARGGFTQVPNFILRDGTLSLGAKVAYSMFLHFAWNNESCFPGQDRLAQHMGMSVPRVNEYIRELKEAGLVEITRRGQGRTNLYRVNFAVKNKRVQKVANSRLRYVEV